MIEFFKSLYQTFIDYHFWLELFEKFAAFGPLPPILLAFVEAFFPMLPLVAIVAFNVASHGFVYGFIFSWFGSVLGAIVVFSFFSFLRNKNWLIKIIKLRNIDRLLSWVNKQNIVLLFLLVIFPFTPSFLINISFGLAGFDRKQFMITIVFGKALMVLGLALFGSSFINAFTKPWYLVLSLILLTFLYFLSLMINRLSGYDDVNKK